MSALGRWERIPACGDRLLRIVPLACAIVAAACTPSPALTPSASVDPAKILFVEVGEKVQAGPPTEELKVKLSNALVLAESSGEDLGYPTYDATTGEIVLSAVTPHGRELIEEMGMKAPHRIRMVTYGAAELQRIQNDAISLSGQGSAGAAMIFATVPDYRDNRTMIVMSALSQPLLDALIARYPADALAVQVNPTGAP